MKMNRNILSRCTLILLLTAAVQGCGTVNTTTTRAKAGDDSVVVRKDINDLLNALAIQTTAVRMFETPGGTLQAQVDMANNDFRQRRFAYRFDWLDARGNVISSQNAVWKTANVPAGGSAVISSTALTPEATDFKLQVRRSN